MSRDFISLFGNKHVAAVFQGLWEKSGINLCFSSAAMVSVDNGIFQIYLLVNVTITKVKV